MRFTDFILCALLQVFRPGDATNRLVGGACVLILILPQAGWAQSYPSKPVRIICGFPTGTAVDLVARLAAQTLTDNLGQQVIVENRTGASGALAAERVAKSAADGYTLLLVSAVNTALPALRSALPYNQDRDFTAISLMAVGNFVLVVHPSVPAKTVHELISLAKQRPGKLSYGSSGLGTVAHLAAELFKVESKVNIIHVPYKGATDSVVATVSGEVDLTFTTLTAVLPFLEPGKERLRPLAVTGSTRSVLLPGIPTMSEAALPGYDRTGWYGISAPAGLPADVLALLNAVVSKGFSTKEMREVLNKQGLEPKVTTPRQFGDFMSREVAQNTKLIAGAGIRSE